MNIGTFCRLPITSCQCIIVYQKNPDSGILFNYDDDDYSRGYGQIEADFRVLKEDDILQKCLVDHDFRSSNVRADDIGCNLLVFDIRYQQIFTASQPIKVEYRFDGVVPNDVNGNALVLTNKLVSVSGDGQRIIDLIEVKINFYMTLSFCFKVKSVFFSKASLYLSGS